MHPPPTQLSLLIHKTSYRVQTLLFFFLFSLSLSLPFLSLSLSNKIKRLLSDKECKNNAKKFQDREQFSNEIFKTNLPLLLFAIQNDIYLYIFFGPFPNTKFAQNSSQDLNYQMQNFSKLNLNVTGLKCNISGCRINY